MPGFGRFGKRWASSGVISEPTANQADTGFAYLGANPPTVELFNSLEQMNDERHNWLFTRLSEVMQAGGVTPSEGASNQLLTAMRALFQPGMAVFGSNGTFTVPATVSRVHVKLWGGGGGGGGSWGPNSAGGGGGGGAYSEGIFNVTPNSSVYVTVGAGGSGSLTLQIYTATAGGTTSFGSFCYATGGSPGAGGLNSSATTAAVGGTASGGNLNLNGIAGGLGQRYVDGMGGGVGGSAPFGGGLSSLSLGGGGSAGSYPGGGGTGAGMKSPAGASDSYMGGAGAPGLCVIYW